MTTSDNGNTDSKNKDADIEKTVILHRCAKHGVTFMASEGCPECAKEKDGAAG